MIKLFVLTYYCLFLGRYLNNREAGGWFKRAYDAAGFTVHNLFPIMSLCRKDPVARGIWTAHLRYFFGF